RPGGVAREDIHFARLERGEALLRGERREAYLAGIAQHRRRDRAAEVDVDAAPHALRVGQRETGEPGVHPALHEAFAADRIERRLRSGRNRDESEEQEKCSSHQAPWRRKSRTTAIWSACCSVGACPTPRISTTFARGPRSAISAAVSRARRSDSSPRIRSVGQRTAS